MPLISGRVDSIALSDDKKTITINGYLFGNYQYSVSYLGVSTDGVIYTEVDSYDTWSGSQVIGSFTLPLSSGNYYVKLVTSDNYPIISGSTGISVLTSLVRTNISISISIGSF